MNLAAGLVLRGHDTVIALLDHLGDLETEAEGLGVTLERLYRPERLAVPKVLRFVRLVRRWKPDVVHPYLPRDNALVTLIKPFLGGARLTWGVRASDVDLTKYPRSTRLLWPFVVRASRFADLIIANSYAGARHHVAAGYPEHKMVVIPNGIDTERFRPDPELGRQFREECGIPKNAPVVGMLGRFDPMKGHDEFPAIFARVIHEVPEVFALVVGLHTDEQGQRFRRSCKDLGIAERVVLRQQTSTPEAMLNAIDVLALPSLSEGFPNVVAEAMACGKPVVAYDVGDVRRIVGECGVVVGVRDAARLSAGLADFLSANPRIQVPNRHLGQAHSTFRLTVTTEHVLESLLRNAINPRNTKEPRP